MLVLLLCQNLMGIKKWKKWVKIGRLISSSRVYFESFCYYSKIITLDIGRNLNVHKTFRLHEKCPKTEFFLVRTFPYSD